MRLAAHYEAPPQRLLYLNPMADPAPATLPGVYQAQATQPPAGGQPPVGTQPPAGQPRPPAQPGGQSVITAPNPDTTAIVSPDGTQLVIRARNEEELQRIIGVIKALLPTLKRESQVELKIVPLQYADSTLTVNELTQIFARLTVQGNGLTLRNQQQGLGFCGFNLQNQALGNVVLFPLPRMNAILLGAPKASEEVIIAQIKTLDQPNTPVLQPVRYPLKRAAAAIVQQQILNLFRLRYPSDQGNNLQVTVDPANNAVLVQAGPADQKDIAAFIELLDVEPGANGAVNDIKVIRLRNAFASEMAQILFEVLQNNVYNPQASATSSGGGGGQQLQGAFGTGAGGAFGQQQFGQQQGGVQLTGGTTASTKTTVLRLRDANGRPVADSGILADVSVTPDARINALVIAAPEKTMKMIEALVTELDGVAAAKSYVKLFQLKKADATAVQTLLFNLFSRQQQTGGAGGFNQGGLGGAGGFGTAQTQGVTRPLLTLTGNPGDGSALIDLRITVDPRTNSLIVGGSQNDLDLVDSVIRRLEAVDTPQVVTEVVKLKNAAAADVQTALNGFLTGVAQFNNALQNPINQTATFTGIQRQTFFLQAEPITNQLIIGAPPALLPDILRLIQAVDAAPPQVYVEVLVAEVRLNNQEEFGVEVGLQSNVLFARGGATTSSPGSPGFNFNTTSALPNAANASPNVVGFQGLGNLGTGRASPTLGVGGFVLSAASDTFNLLIRALKAQGRLDVLSRPSLTLADNQTGFFQVGQNYPQITASTLNAQGFVQNSITYTPIGVVLRVTPRISPDGQILMRVEPQVSSVSQTTVQIGNGVLASAIDTQTVETTVLAGDGETVVLGGLISKRDEKQERKIPWVGDLPWVGAAFRFRTQAQERREVIFIMTPRIMRSVADMRAVFAAEAKKMSWSIQDVANVTGVNPDVLRGKAAGDLCLDNITGPAPAYLPLSGTGAIAPTYYPGAVYGQNPVAAPVPTAGAPAVPAATYPVVPPAIYPTQPTAAQPPAQGYPTGAVPVQPGVVAPPAAANVPGNVPGVVAPPAVQPTAYQPAPATPPAGYTPTAAAGSPPTGQQPWGR
ncbi:MAG: secretin N-terminal domain-containing protein [Gemmataceae bacterium]